MDAHNIEYLPADDLLEMLFHQATHPKGKHILYYLYRHNILLYDQDHER